MKQLDKIIRHTDCSSSIGREINLSAVRLFLEGKGESSHYDLQSLKISGFKVDRTLNTAFISNYIFTEIRNVFINKDLVHYHKQGTHKHMVGPQV